MDIYIWLTGAFFIICGILIRKYPILIAGYNTMKKEQKANVDIKGLSSFMCKWFIILGCLQISAYYFCLLAGLKSTTIMIMAILTFIVLIYMIVKAQKFDHNKRSKWQPVFIVAFLLIVAGGIIYNIYSDSRVPEIIIQNGRLSISGTYGLDKPVQDIKSIQLTETLPEISFRSNGFSFGSVNKGHFREASGETCILFLASDEGPYIQITPETGETIYVNLNNKADTRQTYNELKEKLLKESVRQ